MQQLVTALTVAVLFIALCYFVYNSLDRLQSKVTQLELQMARPPPSESEGSRSCQDVENLFSPEPNRRDQRGLAPEEESADAGYRASSEVDGYRAPSNGAGYRVSSEVGGYRTASNVGCRSPPAVDDYRAPNARVPDRSANGRTGPSSSAPWNRGETFNGQAGETAFRQAAPDPHPSACRFRGTATGQTSDPVAQEAATARLADYPAELSGPRGPGAPAVYGGRQPPTVYAPVYPLSTPSSSYGFPVATGPTDGAGSASAAGSTGPLGINSMDAGF